jgi:hypothetical protein
VTNAQFITKNKDNFIDMTMFYNWAEPLDEGKCVRTAFYRLAVIFTTCPGNQADGWLVGTEYSKIGITSA